MRLRVALLALTISTPVYAQSAGSFSGAVSTVNIVDPPAAANTTSTSTNHLVTPPTMVAPGLAAAGVETCLGSSSGGLSLMGGGITFGSTKVDEGCTIRLLARQLFAFGFRKAALALMCEDQHVVLAMNETGTPCPPPPTQLAQNDPISRPPAAEATQGGLFSFLPPLAFAGEDLETPAADETPEPPPLTEGEQALFDRESRME